MLNSKEQEGLIQSVEDFQDDYNVMVKIVTENISKAQENQAKHYNKKHRDAEFKLGDMVLLSTANINIATTNRKCSKLQPLFIGPYRIIQVISKVAYKLELPSAMKVHPVVHISQLRRYLSPTEDFPQRKIKAPEPIIIDDEIEYEVEEIMDKKTLQTRGKPRILYLVKWRGYPSYENSWEPVENLRNAKELVAQYERHVEGNMQVGRGVV